MSLSHSEERRLVKAARAGDQIALNRLLNTHRRRLHALARHFDWPRAVMTDDLVQEGALRLADIICKQDAQNKFDPDAEVRLWSFAYTPVRWRMIAFTREVTRISKRVLARRNTVIKTIDDLWKERAEQPSLYHIAARTNLAPEVVRQVLEINTREVSLEDAADQEAAPFESTTRFSLKPFHQLSLMALKHTAGAQKYMVLLILKELRGITLNLVTDYVRDEQAEIGIDTPEQPAPWARWHRDYDAPDAIPAVWKDVVRLFKNGPPQLHYPASQARSEKQAEAYEKSYAGLRKFYTRATRKVSQIGWHDFTEQIDVFRQHRYATDS